jgi:hypothetical protein
MTFAHTIDRVAEMTRASRARLERFRLPLFLAALAFFLGGAALSAASLDLQSQPIELVPLLLLLVGLVPITLLYGAFGIQLLAASARLSIPIGRAYRVATYATLAEALPVPGGAIVRTGALVGAGAKVGEGTTLVIGTAALWIALAAAGAGVAIVGHDQAVGLAVGSAGAAATAMLTVWLWRVAGPRIAGLTVLHRMCGLMLFAVRLWLSFAALSFVVPIGDMLPFAFASIAGSAASIAPAGLGVGEALAALLSDLVAVPAAVAFLAVGLNRIGGLGATALVALILELAHGRGQKPREAA